MSIAQSSGNINREEQRVKIAIWLFAVSIILGIGSSVGLGLLFEKINTPSPIQITCSKEVFEGLRNQNPSQIPKVKMKD